MPEEPELEARMSSALGPSSRSEEENRVVLAERARQNDRIRKFEKRAASRAADLAAFRERLEEAGVSCTVRRSPGGEIGAACGQLANASIESKI